MEKLIETLRNIGIADAICDDVIKRYDGDIEGLRNYVLLVQAMMDDRHEYMA